MDGVVRTQRVPLRSPDPHYACPRALEQHRHGDLTPPHHASTHVFVGAKRRILTFVVRHQQAPERFGFVSVKNAE